MNEFEKIDIFCNILSVQEVFEGYEKRKKYIITTSEKKYFVKILPHSISEEEINKVKWIHFVYEENGIPLIPLVDVIVQGNQTILIYDYFDGQNLKESNLSIVQCKEYGMKVAKEVKKMNEITNIPIFFHDFDLSHHFHEYVKRFQKVIQDKKDLFYEVFDGKFVEHLLLRFESLYHDIISNEVMLNHNDIKLANIMVDDVGNFYFVDIDPIDLTYRGFNVNYSIFNFLLDIESTRNEREFIKAFLREYDGSKSFMKELEYFLISDFINELSRLLDQNFTYLLEHTSFVKRLLFNDNHSFQTIIYESI